MPETVYLPALAKAKGALGTCVLFGLILLAVSYRAFASWAAGGAVPSVSMLFLFAVSLCLLGGGALLAWGAFRKLPRLTATPKTLTLTTLWGEKTVLWKNLTPFLLMERRIGRGGKKLNWLRAEIVGTLGNQKRGGFFDIPDSFEDLRALGVALNEAHAKAWEGVPEAEIKQILETHFQEEKKSFVSGLQREETPLVTAGLLLVLGVVYVLEILASGDGNLFSFSAPVLLALGGLSRFSFQGQHEAFRLLTAPLLHGGLLHIFLNSVGLYYAGTLLEGFVGRAWFFVIFFVGAVGGSLFSLALNDMGAVSVGASGAIMGLFMALYVLSYRLSLHQGRTQMQIGALQVLVPSLLPLLIATGLHIDYAAHLGGALGGAGVGLLLLRIWAKDNPLPPFSRTAKTLAAFALLLFALSIAQACAHFAAEQNAVMFVPPPLQF